MALTRRQLLVLAAAPPLLAAVGVGAVGLSWWLQDPGADFRYLTELEATVLRGLAGAAWPPTPACPVDGATCGLDRYLDENLAPLGQLQREGIRLLLHAVNELTLATHGGRFIDLDRAVQSQAVASWLDSEVLEVRSAVQSIVVLTGMGYTSHPDASGAFGSLYRCGYGR